MPDTIAELCDALDESDSQSSLMKKAEPKLRHQLIDALIKREPYTYRAVFEKFQLDELGISFTAFYYWARKVRRSAALIEMARACPEDQDPTELLPRVLAQRLLDASLDEDLTLSTLARLTQAYRMASYVDFARRRLEAQSSKLADKRRKDEFDEIRRLTDLYLNMSRHERTTEMAGLAETPSPDVPPPANTIRAATMSEENRANTRSEPPP